MAHLERQSEPVRDNAHIYNVRFHTLMQLSG